MANAKFHSANELAGMSRAFLRGVEMPMAPVIGMPAHEDGISKALSRSPARQPVAASPDALA
jgi:hypothetical protein